MLYYPAHEASQNHQLYDLAPLAGPAAVIFHTHRFSVSVMTIRT